MMAPSLMMRLFLFLGGGEGVGKLFGVGGIGCFDIEAQVGLGEKGVQRNGGRGP